MLLLIANRPTNQQSNQPSSHQSTTTAGTPPTTLPRSGDDRALTNVALTPVVAEKPFISVEPWANSGDAAVLVKKLVKLVKKLAYKPWFNKMVISQV